MTYHDIINKKKTGEYCKIRVDFTKISFASSRLFFCFMLLVNDTV